MKRRSKGIVAAACVLIGLFIIACLSDPIFAKLATGDARILKRRIPVTIQAGGRDLRGVQCFQEPGPPQNHRSRRLVLHLKNSQSKLGPHILIVDAEHKAVFLPNSGRGAYRLVWDRWLLQAESGVRGVAFGNPTLDANDPDFQRSAHVISFTIPPVLDLPAGRWNVTLDPNYPV